MKTSTFALLFIPGLAALIGVLITSSSYEAQSPATATKSDPRELACFAGQMAIKQKLAIPSNADFRSCIGAFGIADDGANKYRARGVFETPDSSGIKRQHGYDVSVEKTPDGYKTFILRID